MLTRLICMSLATVSITTGALDAAVQSTSSGYPLVSGQPAPQFQVVAGYALNLSANRVTASQVAGTIGTQHGPSVPSAFVRVVGTWEDARCGQVVNAIRLSTVSGRLVGRFTARPISGDMRTCKIALGEPVSLELINPGFDGRMLWFWVEQGVGKPEMQMTLSGETLFFQADGASRNAVPYNKVK